MLCLAGVPQLLKQRKVSIAAIVAIMAVVRPLIDRVAGVGSREAKAADTAAGPELEDGVGALGL